MKTNDELAREAAEKLAWDGNLDCDISDESATKAIASTYAPALAEREEERRLKEQALTWHKIAMDNYDRERTEHCHTKTMLHEEEQRLDAMTKKHDLLHNSWASRGEIIDRVITERDRALAEAAELYRRMKVYLIRPGGWCSYCGCGNSELGCKHLPHCILANNPSQAILDTLAELKRQLKAEREAHEQTKKIAEETIKVEQLRMEKWRERAESSRDGWKEQAEHSESALTACDKIIDNMSAALTRSGQIITQFMDDDWEYAYVSVVRRLLKRAEVAESERDEERRLKEQALTWHKIAMDNYDRERTEHCHTKTLLREEEKRLDAMTKQHDLLHNSWASRGESIDRVIAERDQAQADAADSSRPTSRGSINARAKNSFDGSHHAIVPLE